jgi:hypothetical protein
VGVVVVVEEVYKEKSLFKKDPLCYSGYSSIDKHKEAKDVFGSLQIAKFRKRKLKCWGFEVLHTF